jgi:predicted nuclease of restriction endonuclease-like RecB superfamily
MLPSELLIHRIQGKTLIPKRIPLDVAHLNRVQELIDVFKTFQGRRQLELDQHLEALEGNNPDYRLRRGWVHLLKSEAFSTFESISPLDPQTLREQVFRIAAQTVPGVLQTPQTLSIVATLLGEQLGREIYPQEIQQGLYADLPENRILTQFEPPTPEALIHRYNLSQVQGIFYKASQVTITAHRNDPGEYKLLFSYLKLFQLMAYIEGDADHGFTITVDGPTSLFKASTRYGLALAKLLPALLHVSRWTLTATLETKASSYKGSGLPIQFRLDSDCGLVSHYPPGKPFDSMLEAAFAERWSTVTSEWKLEREVDLIPIPGSVMIPDFRLVHPDGRTFLLEIVGYWRPEYLRKKFAQVRRSGSTSLILAISERLNLEKAGVKVEDLPAKIIWFKDKLLPKAVLEVLREERES